MATVSSFRQQLIALSNSGGSHKDQAEKYVFFSQLVITVFIRFYSLNYKFLSSFRFLFLRVLYYIYTVTELKILIEFGCLIYMKNL